MNRNTQIVINDDLLRKIVYCIEKAIGDDLQQYLRENHRETNNADYTSKRGQYQYKLKNTCGER